MTCKCDVVFNGTLNVFCNVVLVLVEMYNTVVEEVRNNVRIQIRAQVADSWKVKVSKKSEICYTYQLFFLNCLLHMFSIIKCQIRNVNVLRNLKFRKTV